MLGLAEADEDAVDGIRGHLAFPRFLEQLERVGRLPPRPFLPIWTRGGYGRLGVVAGYQLITLQDLTDCARVGVAGGVSGLTHVVQLRASPP